MPDIPIVVLGGGCVGKSCITIQYIQGHFPVNYNPTIEELYRKPVDIDGIPSVLTIVDTAGQEAFRTMAESYMKSGLGFILVYSITDSESFQQLKKIYAQLKKAKGDATLHAIVVGNKLDLSAQRAVTTDEGQMFAKQIGQPFVEMSAKDRLHVEDIFTDLIRAIRGGGKPPEPAVVAEKPVASRSTAPQNEQTSQPPPPAPAPPPKKEKKKSSWCSMV